MKKLFIPLTIIFFSTCAFAQKTFDSKKKTSEGKHIVEVFEESIIPNKNRGANIINPINADVLNKKVIKDENAVIYLSDNQFGKESKNARKSFKEMNIAFLENSKNELQVKSPKDEFKFISEETDELGFKHFKVQQHFKGVPIYGGEATLHTEKSGITSFLTGKIFPTNELNTNANYSGEEAILKALSDLKKTSIIQKKGIVGAFLEMLEDESELIILNENNTSKLVYYVTVRPNVLERWVYFLDAQTGEIIDKYNHTCTLDGVFKAEAKDLNGITRSINIIQKGASYYLIDPTKQMYKSASSVLPDKPIGAVWTIDASNSKINDDNMKFSHVTSLNSSNWTPTAVSAHNNASLCYDYFLNKFGRNSLNASGGNIISVINIADEDGKGMDNAYWNGQFMGYGNGQVAFKPLAGALDVAGHEMTHGVTENTAKLEYRNQSGALNESFSDVFAVLIDRKNWTLGEDVVKTNIFPSGALRSLENPNQGGKNSNGYQPKNMSQYAFLNDTPSEDNGGVHINSGIPNHAFYKFATGTSMNLDKAEKVYYRVLTTYMTRTSKFVDLRLAVIQSAKDIYGDGQETAAAKSAFDFVGILDPNASTGGTTTPPTPAPTTLPVNPGTESLVVFDPRTSDQSIYAGAFAGNTNFVKITNGLGCLSKPSVTDDGAFVYFVGKDKHIYRVDLNNKTSPVKLSDSPSWRNVAISKDGKQLAALASVIDKKIYVFDLVNNKNKSFTLYNPTYTSGVSTGEVQYADSFEWDYSGENLIYDAFNRAQSVFSNIEYWDVGIMRVWDSAKKTFSDGTIDKMFTNLDEGDNIGNPALAKTNSSILAFDYYNGTDNSYFVITVDLSKTSNNIKLIEENNDIGYPDFSKADKVLVFNSLKGTQNIVKGINLASDKISPVGASTTYFTDAKWAVWYAAGVRALPSKEAQVISVSTITDKQPGAKFDIQATTNSNLVLSYTLVSGDATLSGKSITLGTKPGKVVIQVFQVGDSKYSSNSLEISFCIVPSTPTLNDLGKTIVASGGTLYQFYINNNPVGGQTTSNTLNKDFAGSYTVKNVTSDGCASQSSNIIVGASGVLGAETEVNVKLSPNPADDWVAVIIPIGEVLRDIKIYDTKGTKVFAGNSLEVNVGSLISGVFVMKIMTDKGSYSSKFIKK